MYTDRKEVKCPVCGGTNNHIKSVQIIYGNDECVTSKCLQAARNGNIQYLIDKRELDFRLRGMSVCIMWECEFGDHWTQDIFTHKGEAADVRKEG